MVERGDVKLVAQAKVNCRGKAVFRVLVVAKDKGDIEPDVVPAQDSDGIVEPATDLWICGSAIASGVT